MTADHAAQLLVAVGLMLIMASVARALQRKRVALLESAGAQALPACTCTITRTLSWLRLPRAEAYLLDGVLVVFTHNGAVRIFRRSARTEPTPGWPFRFADVVATEVTQTEGAVKGALRRLRGWHADLERPARRSAAAGGAGAGHVRAALADSARAAVSAHVSGRCR